MTVLEKINSGEYTSKLYPKNLTRGSAEWREAWLLFKKDEQGKIIQFRDDLFREYGVENHPDRQTCFSMSWEEGHATGLADVAYYFIEYVEKYIKKEICKHCGGPITMSQGIATHSNKDSFYAGKEMLHDAE